MCPGKRFSRLLASSLQIKSIYIYMHVTRIQCGKPKRDLCGSVFILWEPFRSFTWLPILALRPSTKAPPVTISNPYTHVSISPFRAFIYSAIHSFPTASCNSAMKRKKTKKQKRLAHDDESLVFVSPLLAGFVDCACVCTSCYIVR